MLITFVPALMVGLACGWRMAGLTWQKGLAAGVAAGFVGVGWSMDWYWFTSLTPGSSVITVGFFLLPILSAASAWAICRHWARCTRG